MAAVARVFHGCRFLMSLGAAAGGGKKPVAAAVGVKATQADVAAAKENRGIMKLMLVSDALRKFVDSTLEVSRTGTVKLIWAHIKAQGLQIAAHITITTTPFPTASTLVTD